MTGFYILGGSNFLKRKVFKTTPTNVALVMDAPGGSDSSMKYHKASDKVSYYNKVATEQSDSESDGLSLIGRGRHGGGSFHACAGHLHPD